MTAIYFPDDPSYFSNHKIYDVLDYYDGPKIYTFYTQSNDFYLAYYSDDDGSCEEWLFVPTSESTVHRVVRNELSIRQFFELCDVCYVAKMKRSDVVEVERKYFSEIERDYLPGEHAFLDSSSTLISVRLVKNGISPRTTSETVVSTVVTNVRKLFKETMKALQREHNAFQEFSPNPDFSLDGILNGSVNIVLKPIQENALISHAARVIERVALGHYDDVSEQLVERVERSLISLAPNPNSRLYGFDEVEIGGVVGDGTPSKRLSFSLSSSTRSKLVAKYGTALQVRSVILTGSVDEGTESAEEFRLSNLESNSLELTEVRCKFDSDDLEYSDEIDEAAVWAFMKVSSAGKKLRVSGDYFSRDKILNVQSIQIE